MERGPKAGLDVNRHVDFSARMGKIVSMVASPVKLLQSTLDSKLVRLDRLTMVVQGESHDGRDGRFFHALPVELFLLTIAFLDWRETVTASHVSVYWRKVTLARASNLPQHV